VSISDQFSSIDSMESDDGGDEVDETEEEVSYTAEKTAGAIGIAVGLTASVLMMSLLLAYIFGVESERLKKAGLNKNKLRYAAKEPLYAVVGIALGYVFNVLLIGEELNIIGAI